MKEKGSILLKLCFIFLSSLLIIHSSITIAYNFPMTPFKEKVEKYVSLYMTPLFEQTWTLFAPNPVNTNNNVQVKLEYMEDESKKESEWISLSDKFHYETKKSYIHPYHHYSSALTQLEGDAIEIIYSLAQDDDVNTKDIPSFFYEHPTANILYHFTYIIMQQEYKKIESIQIRYVLEKFPEYRSNENESVYEFGYLPKANKKDLLRGYNQ